MQHFDPRPSPDQMRVGKDETPGGTEGLKHPLKAMFWSHTFELKHIIQDVMFYKVQSNTYWVSQSTQTRIFISIWGEIWSTRCQDSIFFRCTSCAESTTVSKHYCSNIHKIGILNDYRLYHKQSQQQIQINKSIHQSQHATLNQY